MKRIITIAAMLIMTIAAVIIIFAVNNGSSTAKEQGDSSQTLIEEEDISADGADSEDDSDDVKPDKKEKAKTGKKRSEDEKNSSAKEDDKPVKEEKKKDKSEDKKEEKTGNKKAPGEVLEVGDEAPDFTTMLVDGGSFTLSEHSDECALINFWATWCPPCVGEMPAFQKLLDDDIEGLSIICVNCMEDRSTVKKFVRDEHYTFNVGFDTDGEIMFNYPTDGIPYTLVVHNGVIKDIFLGSNGADIQYKVYLEAINEAMGADEDE
ncbi:MAG: TlpA family protein disulfide reductase [Lachnospiraceae bacterium]|nr:TlpA family protein disulfide reductase [Lachnospiraceae bacterium]